MSYGLEHIYRECIDEKAKVISTARGKTPGAKFDIYENSWNSLNSWIESRMAKQKGAGISGFGCFCWELKGKNGITQCRPIFVLSDQFVKSFKIKRQRIFKPPQTTPIEEVNFSLLAIKFSKNLTKDMVFSGLRDILRKIGDFVYRGYEIEIPFTIGVLRAKERRVRFEFNQLKLQQILPDSITPGIYAMDDSPLAYIEDEDYESEPPTSSRQDESETWSLSNQSTVDHKTNNNKAIITQKPSFDSLPRINTADAASNNNPRANNNSNNIHLLNFAKETTTNIKSNTNQQDDDQSNNYNYNDNTNNNNNNQTLSETDTLTELPPELRSLLDNLENNKSSMKKEEWRKKITQRVLDQAYMRCLDNVEYNARLDDLTLLEAKQLYDDWQNGIKKQKEVQKQQGYELKESLDTQIEYQHKKTQQEKHDARNAAIKCIIPDVPAFGSVVDQKGEVISSRKKIAIDLARQIADNANNKQKTKTDTLHQERDYLKKLALEIDLHNVMKRADHLEKQKALLEAWEKDGHIRNLKKLQPFGTSTIKGYITTHLGEEELNRNNGTFGMSGSGTFGGNMTAGSSSSRGGFGNSGTFNFNNTSGTGGGNNNNNTLSQSLNSPLFHQNPNNTIGHALNKSIGYDPRRGRVN